MSDITENSKINGLSVNIFDFTNYRHYLKAYYRQVKAVRPYFSYRYFSRMAGLGGKNYLQMVMVGKRNLSSSTACKFARALRLTKKEAAYFEAMVLYTQADTSEEKDRYFAELLRLKPSIQIEGITPDQFEYLTNPLYVVIREMAAIKEFNGDPVWIRGHIRAMARPPEIKKALDLLEKLKLLVRDGAGNLTHSGKTVETPDVESLEILNYHRQVLNETKEALVNIPYEERDITSMTIPIPQALIPEVKELLRKCREEIAALVNQSSNHFYEVFQINTQFFPVTKINQIKKKGEIG